jgi:hypothetical protein
LTDIKKLTEEEFNSTFIPPMTFMYQEDETSDIDLIPYVESVINIEKLDTSIDNLKIDSIYHNGKKTYEHVLINYGIDNIFLLFIVDLNDKSVYGYYFLDLSKNQDLENK